MTGKTSPDTIRDLIEKVGPHGVETAFELLREAKTLFEDLPACNDLDDPAYIWLHRVDLLFDPEQVNQMLGRNSQSQASRNGR